MTLSSVSTFRSWEVLPGAPAVPPGALFRPEQLPERIVNKHFENGTIDPVHMYEVTGAEYGGLGMLSIEGEIFAPRECFPDYLERLARGARAINDDIWYGALFASNRRRIRFDHTVLAPFHPNLVYGHFLLEILPRLLLADAWDKTGAPLVLSTRSPPWVKTIVEAVVPARKIIWFDSSKETIIARAFLVPGVMQSPGAHHLHPEVKRLIADLKTQLKIGNRAANQRLYLSRRNKSDGWHSIAEEHEVERVFADFGFDIIHPEGLKFSEQVKLFDRAAVIAGEFSSALHNSLFARSACRVLCINWINWYQSRICALLDQPVAYLPTADGDFRDYSTQAQGFQSIRVDLNELRAALQEFLEADFGSSHDVAQLKRHWWNG